MKFDGEAVLSDDMAFSLINVKRNLDRITGFSR
jgi:hypothetical protein